MLNGHRSVFGVSRICTKPGIIYREAYGGLERLFAAYPCYYGAWMADALTTKTRQTATNRQF